MLGADTLPSLSRQRLEEILKNSKKSQLSKDRMYTEQKIVSRAANTAEHMTPELNNRLGTMEWYAAFTKLQDYQRPEERSVSQESRFLAFCV